VILGLGEPAGFWWDTFQAAIDGLAKESRQGELVVASGAGIAEVSFDQGAQAEVLVQLA